MVFLKKLYFSFNLTHRIFIQDRRLISVNIFPGIVQYFYFEREKRLFSAESRVYKAQSINIYDKTWTPLVILYLPLYLDKI